MFWAIIATSIIGSLVVIASSLGDTGNTAFNLEAVWSWFGLLITRVPLEVKGRENIKKGQSYIIISNHQSHFDIPALMYGMGVQFRWIIKMELREVPLFGYALYRSRHVFIDRRDRESSIRSINDAVDRLPPGVSVMFFAEGTRSEDGVVREFKKGGFHIAVQKKIPVLPVTINGSWKVMPDRNSMSFNSVPIQVVIGEPIDTTGYTEDGIDKLMERTRNAVIDNLDPHYPEATS